MGAGDSSVTPAWALGEFVGDTPVGAGDFVGDTRVGAGVVGDARVGEFAVTRARASLPALAVGPSGASVMTQCG